MGPPWHRQTLSLCLSLVCVETKCDEAREKAEQFNERQREKMPSNGCLNVTTGFASLFYSFIILYSLLPSSQFSFSQSREFRANKLMENNFVGGSFQKLPSFLLWFWSLMMLYSLCLIFPFQCTIKLLLPSPNFSRHLVTERKFHCKLRMALENIQDWNCKMFEFPMRIFLDEIETPLVSRGE